MDESGHGTSPPATPRTNGWLFPGVALGLALVAVVAWSVVKPTTSARSSPAPSVAVPAPTPSPPVFSGTESITFNFDRRRSMPYTAARVEVRRYDHDLAIKVTLTPGNAPDKDGSSLAEVAGPSTLSRPWSFTMPDRSLEFAVIPGYVRNVASLNHGRIQIVYFANVGMSALVIERDRKNDAEGFVWSDYGGTVRGGSGVALASATVLVGASPVTVFEDGGAGVWGYFDESDSVVEPATRAPVGTLRVTSIADGGPGGFTRLKWLGLLPDGATDLELSTDGSVTWGSAPLGRSGRLVIAGYTESADNARSERTGVHGISYTDASGARHAVKP